jgi:hypothetical protein
MKPGIESVEDDGCWRPKCPSTRAHVGMVPIEAATMALAGRAGRKCSGV